MRQEWEMATANTQITHTQLQTLNMGYSNLIPLTSIQFTILQDCILIGTHIPKQSPCVCVKRECVHQPTCIETELLDST